MNAIKNGLAIFGFVSICFVVVFVIGTIVAGTQIAFPNICEFIMDAIFYGVSAMFLIVVVPIFVCSIFALIYMFCCVIKNESTN